MRPLTPLLAVAVAGLVGCSSGQPEVGACTNADPNLGVSLNVEVVSCDSDEATTKIVSETADGASCKEGRLTFEDETFCTELIKK